MANVCGKAAISNAYSGPAMIGTQWHSTSFENPVRAGLVETAESYPFSYLGHSERSVGDTPN